MTCTRNLTAHEIEEMNHLKAYVNLGEIGNYIEANVRNLVNLDMQEKDAREIVTDTLQQKLRKYGISCPDLDV